MLYGIMRARPEVVIRDVGDRSYVGGDAIGVVLQQALGSVFFFFSVFSRMIWKHVWLVCFDLLLAGCLACFCIIIWMWIGVQLTRRCNGASPYIEQLNPTPRGRVVSIALL